MNINLSRASQVLAILFLAAVSALAADHNDIFLLTSTNDATGNQVLVFKLNAAGPASLNFVSALPTGGNGGASGNAGAVQFRDSFGAVVNYGSNNFTRLVRDAHSIRVSGTIALAPDCVQPVSVALKDHRAFVLGSNCAESHSCLLEA